MSIDFGGRKPKRAPFVGKWFEVEDFSGRPGRLDLVVIDHDGEIAQPMLMRGECRFPDRTLIDLAVAHHDKDLCLAPLDLERDRSADADWQAVTKSTGGGFDAGNLYGLGMTAKDRIEATEAVERLERKETLIGEHHILGEASVTLAQDASVATFPLWILRPVLKDVVVKHAHDL